METKPKRTKVLIIEDDFNMRIFLCNLLRTHGFEPLEAPDQTAGLKMARAEQPALIVLDGMLPDEQSGEIYYRLKSDPELQHIPVVMLATMDQRTFCYYQKCQSLQHSLKVPKPEAFLSKPTEAEEFLGAVHRLMEQTPASNQRKAP